MSTMKTDVILDPKMECVREGKSLKILCIHGYRQNASSFKEKLGAFRKVVKNYAELVFISAPLQVPSLPSESPNQRESPLEERGWWFSSQDNFDAQQSSSISTGFDESLELISSTFKEQGPFDGILGFSQGAALVANLCGLKEQNRFPFHFTFAIIIAGFKSRSSTHNDAFTMPISCKTLHVYGETDRVIPKDMSEDLLAYFKKPQVLVHPGGHFVPASSQHKAIYTEFLESFVSHENS